jgi:hypothetical protein
MWTEVAEMPKGKPFPEKVLAYFDRRVPFAHLNRKEREFVREYERDRKRRYRARKKRRQMHSKQQAIIRPE